MRGALAIILLVYSSIMLGQGTVDDYWQQKVDYEIRVTLDDSLHELHGHEQLRYHNQSPDTLGFLIFHLWPNAYKHKGTALAKQLTRIGSTAMLFASPEELGYIDSLAFTLDGKPCVWEYHPEHIDICTIYLERPLLPGQEVEVATPFRVKLPSGNISRLGHIGQSYQITQWYPKPAVYDRRGWHPMPYLTQGEFYSEFGSFDVRITLPENYTVGATGDLQNDDERDRLLKLASSTERWISEMEATDGWAEFERSMEFPESASSMKTLHYTQHNVHDFAWFADKRYRVLYGRVDLPRGGDSVEVWTMFTDAQARLWSKSIEYMKDAIYYYSLWNGNYPYRQATAVDGTISAGGGMEYPNVTVIGSAQSDFSLETVIMHEVGHNWFYGILGSNERRYAWMDEGLNSYNELRYLSTKYPDSKLIFGNTTSGLSRFIGADIYGSKETHYFTYLFSIRANSGQRLNLSSEHYSNLNYGTMAYAKTAVWMNYLRHYLGDEVIDSAMQAYFESYKFKHPYPEDFERILKNSTKADLNWFFRQGIDSLGKIDYAIKRIHKSDSGATLTIANRGGVQSPIPLALMQGDSIVSYTWLEGFGGQKKYRVETSFDRVELDPYLVVPEVRRKNNYARGSGPFKKAEPLRVKWLGQIENPRQTELFYTPFVGWNQPSGFTPGLVLYNSILPVKKLNWVAAPMFATKSQSFAFMGEAYYSLTPEGSKFETIDLGVKARRYAHDYHRFTEDPVHYERIEPYVRFNLRPRNYSGYWDDEFTLSSVIVHEELSPFGPGESYDRTSVFTRLEYRLLFDHPAYQTTFSVRGEHFDEFLRASLEVVNHVDLDDVFRLRNRMFVGGFVSNNTTHPRFNWRMEGQRPTTDYAYDHVFLDRSMDGGPAVQQLSESHGGFKIPTAVGSSNLGLVAYNAEVFFWRIPVGIFTDVGMAFQGEVLADAGLCLTGKRHILGVYVPLFYTNNIAAEVAANGRTITDLIRFQASLNLANPFEWRKRIKL